MNDTTTGGKASFETHEPTFDDVKAMIRSAEIHEQSNAPNAAHLYWKTAATSAVTLLGQERAHADKLAEALKFVLNAPHPPRLPSGACICVQHEDAGKLVAEHAKLREGK